MDYVIGSVNMAVRGRCIDELHVMLRYMRN